MNPHNPSVPKDPQTDPSSQSTQKPKRKKELPVVSVPDDPQRLAQEMAEIFEEDQVTHQHGSSEPEGD